MRNFASVDRKEVVGVNVLFFVWKSATPLRHCREATSEVQMVMVKARLEEAPMVRRADSLKVVGVV